MIVAPGFKEGSIQSLGVVLSVVCFVYALKSIDAGLRPLNSGVGASKAASEE
jgi:hypothetical protein